MRAALLWWRWSWPWLRPAKHLAGGGGALSRQGPSSVSAGLPKVREEGCARPLLWWAVDTRLSGRNAVGGIRLGSGLAWEVLSSSASASQAPSSREEDSRAGQRSPGARWIRREQREVCVWLRGPDKAPRLREPANIGCLGLLDLLPLVPLQRAGRPKPQDGQKQALQQQQLGCVWQRSQVCGADAQPLGGGGGSGQAGANLLKPQVGL